MKCVSVFLLGFTILLLLGFDRGLALDPIAEKLEKAKTKFDEQMKKAQEGVKKYFDEEKETSRKKGDKDRFDKLDAEWKTFDTLGILSDAAPDKVKQLLATPLKELDGKYIEAAKSYSKQKDIAERLELEWNVRYKKGLTFESKFEPQRHAAVVLFTHAELEVVMALGTSKTIKVGIDFPEKPFVITRISFDPDDTIPKKFVEDDLLPELENIHSLVHINGGYPGLVFTDDQFARFAEQPVAKTLATLEANFELTAKSAVSLKRFAALSELSCSAAKADDAALAKLVEFSRLHTLRLYHLGEMGSVSKKGIGDLTLLRVSNLELLNSPAVDGELIRNLRKMPHLRNVNFYGSVVIDDDLKEFARCPQLQRIVVGGTSQGVTDMGLAHLKNSQSPLRELVLDSTAVTDEGLVSLANMKSLKSVSLKKTKVTEEGVKKLAANLSMCRIQWDGGTVEPKK